MVKSLNKVEISELPEEVNLQFHVNTNGEKDPKYSQKQIFELNKKAVAVRKGMSKEDKIKLNRKQLDSNYSWRKANGKN